MEQEWQNDAGALTAQAIPQKDVEQACFHALGLVGRNCEYLEQHLARVGADEQTRQAVNDISAAAARLDRTMNEVMTLLDFLRAEEPPQLSPLDLCQMLQQIAAQADMVQEQLNVELTLDYGGLTSCRVMADCSDAELLCLHLLSNALRACGTGGKVQLTLRRCESFWQLTVLDDGCGLPETSREAWLENRRCFLGGAGLGLLLCRECCRCAMNRCRNRPWNCVRTAARCGRSSNTSCAICWCGSCAPCRSAAARKTREEPVLKLAL